MATRRYGGYDLQLGDNDAQLVYAGTTRPDEPPTAGYVAKLQQDLVTLGFRLVGSADGQFGRKTLWAVREFQIYAQMPTVAQEVASAVIYADRLAPVVNTQPSPQGNPINGVVNPDTADLLELWLTNGWRCPVVVEAWTMGSGTRQAIFNGADNIWNADDVVDTTPRMFVRDVSGYYPLPAAHTADDRIVLGDYTSQISGGPHSEPPRHTWPEAEVLPDSLMGTSLTNLTPQQRSTFKIVRAVSEVECVGFVDALNAYDTAFMSVGLYHWTIGQTGSGGEFWAYLAYLKEVEPVAYAKTIQFFGVDLSAPWADPASGSPNGQPLLQTSLRTYSATAMLQGTNSVFTPLADADRNYFRTWHWFFRMSMACRTVDGFARRMWDMARIRIRDILATPLGFSIGGRANVTIGEVYTSELAVAMVVRWHVNAPAGVIRNGQASNLPGHANLVGAYGRALISSESGDPTTWGQQEEDHLIDGIQREVDANAANNAWLVQSMRTIHPQPPATWPQWAANPTSPAINPRHFTLDPAIGNLHSTRGSFVLDTANLPPSPVY